MSRTEAAVEAVSASPRAPQGAASAVIVGRALLGDRSLLCEGAVIRSRATSVAIGTGSAVIENAVVVGTPDMPTDIGRRTVFGIEVDGFPAMAVGPVDPPPMPAWSLDIDDLPAGARGGGDRTFA